MGSGLISGSLSFMIAALFPFHLQPTSSSVRVRQRLSNPPILLPFLAIIKPDKTTGIKVQSLAATENMSMNDHQQQQEPAIQVSKKRKVVQIETPSHPQIQWILPATDEEMKARWYTKSDYKEFKSASKTVLWHMINKSNKENVQDFREKEYCTRGLELMTPVASQHMKKVRREMLAAVWNAQVRQWNEQDTIYDPEAIAKACQRETHNSVRVARNFGIRDELSMREDCEVGSSSCARSKTSIVASAA
jgi:hypothetical protein